ncbi:hypothetical protein B0H63DRAFT_211909 [Podospora didyma]|uniref:Uncharacterized protein n=1 Tax=Podospora didyma TaxID=330526 RepID=A0AAE0NHK6_9PEZI|nr:hypothetical protein B0H63DRAFT_211909 [Podospora didyma]
MRCMCWIPWPAWQAFLGSGFFLRCDITMRARILPPFFVCFSLLFLPLTRQNVVGSAVCRPTPFCVLTTTAASRSPDIRRLGNSWPDHPNLHFLAKHLAPELETDLGRLNDICHILSSAVPIFPIRDA